jgi:predicted transcriptional regulator
VIKKRDRLSLIAAILKEVESGSKKTHIMYAANLSFKLLKKYLETALALGFIQPAGSRYELTAKGRMFLKRYLSFEEKFSEAQEDLAVLDTEREYLQRLCLEPFCRQ